MKKLLLPALMSVMALATLSCSKNPAQEPVPYDYSIASNWMIKTDNPTKDVDLFYIYPTCSMSGNTPSSDLTESEKATALNAYIGSAYCMNEFTNAYAPYYRQISMEYAVNCSPSEDYVKALRETVNKKDVFAALDYFFEHFNNGRPFILAAHSQGSAMTRIVLDEYMPQHPDRYARMVAAYPLGFSYPKQWMANNNVKAATKADDYGVVVTWNTEGPNPTKKNDLLTDDDFCINPLTWSTDSGYAGTDQNKGSLVWDDKSQNIFHIQTPGLADAQINASRVSLTCTTITDYITFEGEPFGDKSLHGYDWSAYIENVKENAQARIAAYKKAHPEVGAGYDYSKADSWMILPTSCPHEVDMFFIYPTCVSTVTDTVSYLSDTDKIVAMDSYHQTAEALSGYTNVFGPYYRQVGDTYIYQCDQDSEKLYGVLRRNGGTNDIFSALNYYFTHYNNGRPFILAAHSQGSAMTRAVLEDYMPQHPDYYSRMIAAYAIGFALPQSWLDANPHIKPATGETDTGVIIGWNTQGPDATEKSIVVSGEDYLINPLTWTTDATYGDVSLNLGTLEWNTTTHEPSAHHYPGIHDAQIDTKAHVLVCTTTTKYGPTLFGDKGLHAIDWSAYYDNIRVNASKRIEEYLGHEPL